MPPSEKKWDANAERDLCVAVIMGAQDGERMRFNWPKVHASMATLGYSFTKDAISQHFSKSIMRDFKGRHGDPSTSTPTTTPKKATTRRKRSTPAKKKIEILDEEDDDAETMVESPVHKKMKHKNEDEDEDLKTSVGVQGKSGGSLSVAEKEAKFENWLANGDGA
ncbi:hypothetical protein FOCG_06636 [Fusarium oxysporum f. sp. radicis-lycopersici 26381]|uniref:Uncharacterized protein n=1 Tax=Fusarium oxysporum Fo47 TaxID=660027 RepID=W9KU09_FUSOX|nr:uncharacterized protein FOBCDRAFT_315877 [Fusarium oxysporum Fo47]EWZ93012.1 hypothetical protein FOWG_05933 [Fusarium oxysporum f. sp. lycopersici MN25]EXL53294.1 hypothetical protein FOCG_06636 [Fusarium oxysporum f. sp. radicis-lycopersici 26381]KAJ4122204.1 hypothetical protein NW765_005035 [Fusarium oxysporum]EWZ47962.1 hypothetical protein FOZG_03695 [Fusarium oxysporum Fo47]KAJ4281316.1 hypothetical protein NW764_004010 [Fusarium oxysporum]